MGRSLEDSMKSTEKIRVFLSLYCVCVTIIKQGTSNCQTAFLDGPEYTEYQFVKAMLDRTL